MNKQDWEEMAAIKSSMDGHPQYVSTCAQERFTKLFVESLKSKENIIPLRPEVIMPTPEIQSQLDIATVCDQIKSLLLEKNAKYGDSALSPLRIFSKSNSEEQINVRIDDKLNRIRNSVSNEDEDPEWDLIGYLILKRVKKLQNDRARNLHIN